MGEKPVGVKEIARRIGVHLARFERDPKINVKSPDYGTRPYYNTNAWHGGRWVAVQYISYQGSTSLAKDRALAYLAWLDAGNVGRHWEFERAGVPAPASPPDVTP
jgi:hypothetical protein